jgi:hypothetical protein
MPAIGRSYAAGAFGLELDGAAAGPLVAGSGGEAVGEVVVERPGEDGIARKHLGAVGYSPIVLECGAGMGKPFSDWLGSTLTRKAERHGGAVVAADATYRERSRLEFDDAVVASIGFPALDASSKDAAKLTVSLRPEVTRRRQGSGKPVTQPLPDKAQKRWLASAFRLTIDGLDCTRTARIEPLVVVQPATQAPIGEERDQGFPATPLEISDLVVTFAETSVATWDAWFDSFVLRGQNGPGDEKQGTLELLAADMKTALFTIGFAGLGIYRLERRPPAGAKEAVAQVTATMYCEELQLAVGAERIAPLVAPQIVRPVLPG